MWNSLSHHGHQAAKESNPWDIGNKPGEPKDHPHLFYWGRAQGTLSRGDRAENPDHSTEHWSRESCRQNSEDLQRNPAKELSVYIGEETTHGCRRQPPKMWVGRAPGAHTGQQIVTILTTRLGIPIKHERLRIAFRRVLPQWWGLTPPDQMLMWSRSNR